MCSNSFVHLYADETVIYTSDTDLRQIQNSLQSDFNLVQKWLHSNKLILNRKKSCCMLFGTRHSRVYSSELQINFDNGTLLEKADSFKYLGLWIDPELSFKPHIDFIIDLITTCELHDLPFPQVSLGSSAFQPRWKLRGYCDGVLYSINMFFLPPAYAPALWSPLHLPRLAEPHGWIWWHAQWHLSMCKISKKPLWKRD